MQICKRQRGQKPKEIRSILQNVKRTWSSSVTNQIEDAAVRNVMRKVYRLKNDITRKTSKIIDTQ